MANRRKNFRRRLLCRRANPSSQHRQSRRHRALFGELLEDRIVLDGDPIAAFTASPTPSAPGQPVEFDGSISSHEDPLRAIAQYAWDFDNDSVVDSIGPVATWTFDMFGSFPVTVTVTDDLGASDTETISIEVSQGSTPPVAEFNLPAILDPTANLTLDASPSFDPDERFGDSIVSYDWDLNNDGTFDFFSSNPVIDLTPAEHAFISSSPGEYYFRLMVTDLFGRASIKFAETPIYFQQPFLTDSGAENDYSEVQFVRNAINPTDSTTTSSVKGFFEFKGDVYFLGPSTCSVNCLSGQPDQFGFPIQETALWRINPYTGEYSGIAQTSGLDILSFAVVGDYLVFNVYNQAGGFSLFSWEANGEPFTFLHADADFAYAANDKLFFVGNDSHGEELWVTDGTIAGTTLLIDAYVGPASSYPTFLGAPDSETYVFQGRTGSNTWSIINSDGTPGGTSRFNSFQDSPFSSATIDGFTYFIAEPIDNRKEIWRTNGTASGTQLFADPANGAAPFPNRLTEFQGELYFTMGTDLWGTDDGVVGPVSNLFFGSTELSADFSPLSISTPSYVFVDDRLYFAAGGSSSTRLYMADGTSASPTVVVTADQIGFAVRDLYAARDRVFVATRNNEGDRLYAVDIATDEVTQIADNGLAWASTRHFTDAAGRVFYGDSAPLSQAATPNLISTKPGARLPSAITVQEGDSFVLSVADSLAFETGLQTFEWDSDFDGVTFTRDSVIDVVNVEAPDGPVTRRAALRITDVWGQQSMAVTQVTIENVAPMIADLGDTSGPFGSPIMLSAQISDPGVNDTLTIEWDLGDGTTVSDVSSIEHTYAAEGEYFASLTVSDSDGAVTAQDFRVVVGPPVTITTSVSDIGEGQSMQLTATLDVPIGEDVVVPISYAGLPIAAIDFGATVAGDSPPSEIVIPAGMTAGSVEIFNLSDDLDEDVEPLAIHFGVPANASLASAEPLIVNLLDDDLKPIVFLSDPGRVVNETDMTFTLTVSLSEPSGREVTVTLGAAGTATVGEDYLVANAEIVVPAGEIQASTTIQVLDDNIGESAEQIVVAIAAAANAFFVGSGSADADDPSGVDPLDFPAALTHIVPANDAPSIQFANVLENISETAGQHQVAVTLSNPADFEITAQVTFGGDATHDVDFTSAPFPQLVVFPPATGIQTPVQHVTFDLTDDVAQESDEAILLGFSEINNALPGTTLVHLSRIIDDDSRYVTVHSTATTLWEDATSFDLVATLSIPSPFDIHVPVVAISSLEEGNDYFLESNEIVIPANEVEGRVSVVIDIDDHVPEANQTLRFSFTPPANAALRGPSTAIVTIKDNDPYVSLRPNYRSVSEGGDIRFTVTLDRRTNRDVTVPVRYTATSARTNDFSPGPSQITIPPGSLSNSFNVGTTDDTRQESTESFRVWLATPTNATRRGSSVNIQIRDNDAAPKPYWVLGPTTIVEGPTTNVTPTLRLPRTSDLPVLVSILVSGTATLNEDFRIARLTEFAPGVWGKSIIFQPGEFSKPVSIDILDDGHYEGMETFRLGIATSGGVGNPLELDINDNESRPKPERKWWERAGDFFQDLGGQVFPPISLDISAIPQKIGEFFSRTANAEIAVVDLGAVFEANQGAGVGPVNPFEVAGSSAAQVIGALLWKSVFDGYAQQGELFFDANKNRVQDFVDANLNGIFDDGELLEPSVETSYDGFGLILDVQKFDANEDGILDDSEGQFVARGGTDVSTGDAVQIPFVSPVAYPTVSPLTTMLSALLEQMHNLAEAEQALTTALGIVDSIYLRSNLPALADQGDQIAAETFAVSAELYSTAIQIASFTSKLVGGISVDLAGWLVFQDLAAKISAPGALLDLSERVVVESLLRGTATRAGVASPDDDVVQAAIDVIVAVNQAYSQLAFSDGRSFVESVAHIQKIGNGGAAEALAALAAGEQTPAEVQAEFSGAGLAQKIAGSEIGNVVVPYIVANDVLIAEGDSGTRILEFGIALSSPSNLPVTVQYATRNDTATAGDDYQPIAGELSWDPGDTTTRIVEIPITGDAQFEPDERFYLALQNSVNAAILDDLPYGAIVNDDQASLSADTTDSSIALVLDVTSRGLSYYQDGMLTFEGATGISNGVQVTAVENVTTEFTIRIGADPSSPWGGVHYVGNGASSTLVIEESFIESLEHVITGPNQGRFEINGVLIFYENVGTIVGELSPALVGIPAELPLEGDSLTLSSDFAGLDPETDLLTTWNLYRDGQLLLSVDDSAINVDLNAIGSYRAEFTASQEGYLPAMTSYEFVVVAPPDAMIVSRHIFYNDSDFDELIAFDKQAMIPGMPSGSEHITSFSGGVNGVIIDIADALNAAAISLDDFAFRTSNSNSTSAWRPLANSPAMEFRPGEGANGSDRFVLTWPKGTITNTWLEIRVHANETTGLAQDDLFYFGNQVGDTNGDGMVNGIDFASVRANPANFLNPAGISNPNDVNRDGLVNAFDLVIIRDFATSLNDSLPLQPPAGGIQLTKQLTAEGEAFSGDEIFSRDIPLSTTESSHKLRVAVRSSPPNASPPADSDDGSDYLAALHALAAAQANDESSERIAICTKELEEESISRIIDLIF